jgi:hypothetical protein
MAGTKSSSGPASAAAAQASAHDAVSQSVPLGRSSIGASSLSAAVDSRLKRHVPGKPGPAAELVDAALAAMLG